jgi:hypothetical protein
MDPIVATIIGVGALIGGGFSVRTLRVLVWLALHGRTAHGTVLWESEWKGKGGTSYQPTVQFRDESEVLCKFRSRSSSRTSQASQPVEVKYDPNYPETRAEIAQELKSMILLRTVGLVLCCLLVIGMFYVTGK